MPDNDKFAVAAKEFADFCADAGTAMAGYWLERSSERMWALCAERYMIPAVERIHAALVAQGFTESNKLDFNDLDDKLFYIPVEDVVRKYSFVLPDETEAHSYTTSVKVFVHTTQNLDYLYVLNEIIGRKTFHIRRIWRTLKQDDADDMFELGDGSLPVLLDNVSGLEEYTDYPRVDEYSRKWRSDRPSLEVYRDLGFLIPNAAAPFSQINLYGDFRDRGYILSYEQEIFPEMNEYIKAEHVNSAECSLIMNCYLPCVERVLEESGA